MVLIENIGDTINADNLNFVCVLTHTMQTM
jgi:hypothetical protein